MENTLDVKAARDAAGLTQADAARAAGISVATWRRAEDDPSSVSSKTRAAVERVLKAAKRRHRKAATREEVESAEYVKRFNASFGASGTALTPATAMTLLTSSDQLWDAHEYDPDRLEEGLPDAVLFRIHGNRAWFDKLAQTFKDLANRMDRGVPPGPLTLADEYALHIAIRDSSETWEDMPPWEVHDGLDRRSNDGDWHGVAAELSQFPFGFPKLTDDELATRVGSDGRARLPRLHPYRWWEPLDLALQEWRDVSRDGIASPGFITRVLFDFIRHNRGSVDEIFEGDLYELDLDTASGTVFLRDASGFTAALSVTHTDVIVPPRDDPFQARIYAEALLEALFRTRGEHRTAECGACGECDECGFDWSLSDDVEGRDAWRRGTGLSLPPALIDHEYARGGSHSSHQAIGIKFNNNVVIRVTIVGDN